MPYVNNSIRDKCSPGVADLIATVRELPDTQRDGALNYIISEIVCNSLRPDDGWNYYHIHRAHGVFQDAGAEFYRRVAGPYEDKARAKNGDIHGYHD